MIAASLEAQAEAKRPSSGAGDSGGMSDVNTLTARPRTAGAPEPDLTTFRLIHRAMRGEVRRLAALTAEQGRTPLPAGREAALQRLLTLLTTEIHAHHTKEDDVIWPVITASAGAVVDLLPLTADHGEIDPHLQRIRDGRGRERAEALAELRDLLDEHITEEEALVFPVIRQYVPAEDFAECEKKFREGTSFAQLKFVLPFIVSYATEEETAHLLKEAGVVMRVLLALFRPGYRRLQREVYGS